MKIIIAVAYFVGLSFLSLNSVAQGSNAGKEMRTSDLKNFYIDVHHFDPGGVNYEAVANAHAKDLAAQNKFGVEFIRFWVDEEKGLVYCLSSAKDSQSINKTHAAAHGLMPSEIYKVAAGMESASIGGKDFYLDIHELGPGKVKAGDVAGAHQKDLAVQGKYGVNFINYWVDEKAGVVMCLSEANDSSSIIKTHQEAHGLIPVKILKVKQGE
jgi:uncharacterized protein DUF4242